MPVKRLIKKSLFIIALIITHCAPLSGACKNFFFDKIFRASEHVAAVNNAHDRKAQDFRENSTMPQKFLNFCSTVSSVVMIEEGTRILCSPNTFKARAKYFATAGACFFYFKALEKVIARDMDN